MAHPVKPDSDKEKMTILWPRDSWDRIEEACRVISEQQKVELTPPQFIRGATMHRVDEVLGAQS